MAILIGTSRNSLTIRPSLGSRVPAVDVQELDDRYVLEADLPGMTQKEIDVKVEDNLLTISSETKDASEQKPNGYIVRERRCFELSAELRAAERCRSHQDRGSLQKRDPSARASQVTRGPAAGDRSKSRIDHQRFDRDGPPGKVHLSQAALVLTSRPISAV